MPVPSYVCGASTIPLLGETIGAHFDRASERWAERKALVVRHQDIRRSYAELRERVDALAEALLTAPGWRILGSDSDLTIPSTSSSPAAPPERPKAPP